jgi:hypothetical protein
MHLSKAVATESFFKFFLKQIASFNHACTSFILKAGFFYAIQSAPVTRSKQAAVISVLARP